MSDAKLMKPLFLNYNFNRGGNKMRAVLWREVSNGSDTYRLWRSAGKPDVTYPNADNDKYLLYLECNGYLAPLGRTEFRLICDCGSYFAYQALYGGYPKRIEFIRKARAESEQALSDLFARENAEIRRMGSSAECQATFLKLWLDEKVEEYQKAKANGGDSRPDFVGALALNELPQCVELFKAYREKRECREQEQRAKAQQERDLKGQEKNKESEALVAAAERSLLEGGAVANVEVTFYKPGRGSLRTKMISHLMAKYGITVPLRTLGWINNNLTQVRVERDGSIRVAYQRLANSRSKGSERVFQCLHELIDAISRSRDTAEEQEVEAYS